MGARAHTKGWWVDSLSEMLQLEGREGAQVSCQSVSLRCQSRQAAFAVCQGLRFQSRLIDTFVSAGCIQTPRAPFCFQAAHGLRVPGCFDTFPFSLEAGILNTAGEQEEGGHW